MRRLVPAICVSVAVLTGCGDENDAPTRTVQLDAGERLRVVAREYHFDPSDVVVQRGGRLEITLDNRGSLAHNIKVLDGNREIGGTPSFAAGESRQATVNVARGEYRLVCTVGDHEEKGMHGTLSVR